MFSACWFPYQLSCSFPPLLLLLTWHGSPFTSNWSLHWYLLSQLVVSQTAIMLRIVLVRVGPLHTLRPWLRRSPFYNLPNPKTTHSSKTAHSSIVELIFLLSTTVIIHPRSLNKTLISNMVMYSGLPVGYIVVYFCLSFGGWFQVSTLGRSHGGSGTILQWSNRKKRSTIAWFFFDLGLMLKIAFLRLVSLHAYAFAALMYKLHKPCWIA